MFGLLVFGLGYCNRSGIFIRFHNSDLCFFFFLFKQIGYFVHQLGNHVDDLAVGPDWKPMAVPEHRRRNCEKRDRCDVDTRAAAAAKEFLFSLGRRSEPPDAKP